MMRVCVGAGGVFWGFDLAGGLYERGYLRRVYTGRPMQSLPLDGIPADRVETAPWIGLPVVAAQRLGLHRIQRRMEPVSGGTFDLWTSRVLAACDVYHCMSGFGARTHSRARRRFGAKTVCDRGSTHILSQRDTLEEEARRLGIARRAISPRTIQRELTEYEECDAVFVPSTYVRDTFLWQGMSPEKVYRIPYGVDTESFKPVAKEDNVFRVLFVGQVGYRKGITYLLQALCPLADKHLEIWVVGPLAPEAAMLLRPFEGCFRYLGRRSKTELSWYYSQCSVLVLPSVEEGLALVQAQAMACGLPVIATPNTGAADLFDDGVEGKIVPARDPESIQRAVLDLLAHPKERAEMGARARRRVESLGGWNDYVEEVVSSYRRLLGEGVGA